MAKKTGYLISFEGGEGGGKTTQIPRIAERLKKLGQEVVSLREPGGTNISEQIRQIVLGVENKRMAFTTEVLLFQAARAQIYDEVVLPSLREGKIVLMDRTRDSSLVYQGMVRHFGRDLIDELNTVSTQDTTPNITFLMDVPVEIGLKRRAETGEQNRLDREKLEFHELVRDSYLQLAKENDGGRWVIIDASQSLDNVENEIWQTIEKRLNISEKED